MREELRALYLALSGCTTHSLASLATALGRSEGWVGDALLELKAEGLAAASADCSLGVRAVSPAVALGPRMAEAETRLLAEQAALERERAAVASLLADFEGAMDPDVLIKLASLAETRARLEELATSARWECLSVNGGRAQPHDTREASKPLNQVALERGVAIRCLYQDAFRNDPATFAYADWLVDLGGEARTLPVIPLQMVIVDREVGLVPLDPESPRLGAVEVRSPGMLAALCALRLSLGRRSAVPPRAAAPSRGSGSCRDRGLAPAQSWTHRRGGGPEARGLGTHHPPGGGEPVRAARRPEPILCGRARGAARVVGLSRTATGHGNVLPRPGLDMSLRR